jgi:hypothetical protein
MAHDESPIQFLRLEQATHASEQGIYRVRLVVSQLSSVSNLLIWILYALGWESEL